MNNLHPRRYVFGGHALGVSARMRRPQDQLLPVQGCSSLPVIGGFHEHKVGPMKLGWLDYDAATTTVNGDYTDPVTGVATTTGAVAFDAAPTDTKSQAEATGVVILQRVRIGRAAVGISKRHHATKEQPSFVIVDPALTDVSIDNFRLAITFDVDFFQANDTFDKLAQAFAKGLSAEQAGLFVPLDGSTGPATTFPAANGTVKCTIVKKIAWDGPPDPEATIHGHVVCVKNFGKIYFGELYSTVTSRRVTMVRFQLGSPDGGDVDVTDVESTGGIWPPE